MTGHERLNYYLDEYNRLPTKEQLIKERKERGLNVTEEWATYFCMSERLRVEYCIMAARLAIRLEDAAALFKRDLDLLEAKKKEVDEKKAEAAERMNLLTLQQNQKKEN